MGKGTTWANCLSEISGSQLAHVGEMIMKRNELIIRIALATRIIIPILAIVAVINVLNSAWEAGILFFSVSVGVFATGLVMLFVGILIIRKE